MVKHVIFCYFFFRNLQAYALVYTLKYTQYYISGTYIFLQIP